tara:strand:+ start:2324 stop:2560 length:237 start_codon:yes stop_codon:yes gene_type:complete
VSYVNHHEHMENNRLYFNSVFFRPIREPIRDDAFSEDEEDEEDEEEPLDEPLLDRSVVMPIPKRIDCSTNRFFSSKSN